ncbi:hypothetical protein HMPREF9318_02028 [Streptococcus urinalis FB127-CNA-2]|uniref:rRNA methylase n=1 Tax=Streptococcus urinalis 2285-97 TaxID=764291 RepID=G5KCK9_9STRE|nr:class I SAM-dependent methyltransferase [Streptococcus urinalis]EHJ57103.1 putative rRNA methylase [Streptococcus urinalis 2285-97]EKS17151.1 hypothetical protein HMPREF9318_02028 [Streptococcus urinalis FB127-CNA-2]VEF32599.1 putative rRNA methylase [Streptococcus urinalis]
MIRPLQLSHDFLSQVIDKESIVVDATMGNGNDTAFLAAISKYVYAFDIQEEAIQKTNTKLLNLGLKNVKLIRDGHENISNYIDRPIKAAIFNLGYLPNADKSIITQSDTTITAISTILELLEIGGRVSVMVYYGHEGGNDEKSAVLEFVSSLDQQQFAVSSYAPLNQKNTPPFLVMIEKLG